MSDIAKHLKQLPRQLKNGVTAAGKFLGREAAAFGREFAHGGIKAVAPVAALVLLITTVSIWSSATFALQFQLDEQTVAYVKDEGVFADACALLRQRMLDDGAECFVTDTPQYSLAVVPASRLLDAEELCEQLEQSMQNDLSDACGVYVDGVLVAVTDDQLALARALKGLLADYCADPEVVEAAFDNQVEYRTGLYPTAEIVSADEAMQRLTVGSSGEGLPRAARTAEEDVDTDDEENGLLLSEELKADPDVILQKNLPALTVKLIKTESMELSIPYDTEKIADSSRAVGYTKVQTPGVNGVTKVTARVAYIDGVEVEREIISEEIVSEPVTEQIVVGTKKLQASQSSGRTVSVPRLLLWPLNTPFGTTITSYYGDGRSHKGMDLAAPAGTAIFAAEDGVVISMNASGSGYGLHFVIDHGNGIQTLYSHCSAIYVEVGQQVTRGETIAAVGRTGHATGNHLHFEVRIDGSPTNPAPFLGIR